MPARILVRLLTLAAELVGLVLIFLAVVRPWYLTWGATDAERLGALPGDEIVGPGASQETRAITIRAPIERVWPWMAQLGQDRGGFYSFDLIENLVGCRMPTVDELRADKHAWALGDRLWMYPQDRAGGAGFATLRSYIPGRALGFGTRMVGTPLTAPENGSWSFVLAPIGDTATRLLVRGRGGPGRSLLGLAFDSSIFEPMHFTMERRMLAGIRDLAETGTRHRFVNHAHVVLWSCVFLLMAVAAIQILVRADWKLPLLLFTAGAMLFELLTLVQPPIAAGAALTAILAWFILAPRRTVRRAQSLSSRPLRHRQPDA